MGGRKERVRESNGRVELTKVNILIAGIHQETPMNIDFGVNNQRQYCKIVK
jgi:hypothetical protein